MPINLKTKLNNKHKDKRGYYWTSWKKGTFKKISLRCFRNNLQLPYLEIV